MSLTRFDRPYGKQLYIDLNDVIAIEDADDRGVVVLYARGGSVFTVYSTLERIVEEIDYADEIIDLNDPERYTGV